MLLQAIGFIAAMVYGYGQLNARLQFIEHQLEYEWTNSKRNEGYAKFTYSF